MKHLHLIFAITLLAISATMTSCHSSRMASGATHPGTWHDVYMPVKVSVAQPIGQSLSGRATMVRDSVVHLSMRVLGFEVAVVHVNTDSVFVVDKFHKYLFAESLDKMLGRYSNLTLGDMQDMMLGVGTDERLAFTNPANGREVSISYAERQQTPAGNCAADVDVVVPMQKTDINAALSWGLGSAQWNSGRTVDFKSPVGYRAVTIDDVLTVLKNM